MLLKTGTYMDWVGCVWLRVRAQGGREGGMPGGFQSCGFWASFPDVGIWGDMFLSHLEVDQEREEILPGKNQFPSKRPFCHSLSLSLLSTEALSSVTSKCADNNDNTKVSHFYR